MRRTSRSRGAVVAVLLATVTSASLAASCKSSPSSDESGEVTGAQGAAIPCTYNGFDQTCVAVVQGAGIVLVQVGTAVSAAAATFTAPAWVPVAAVAFLGVVVVGGIVYAAYATYDPAAAAQQHATLLASLQSRYPGAVTYPAATPTPVVVGTGVEIAYAQATATATATATRPRNRYRTKDGTERDAGRCQPGVHAALQEAVNSLCKAPGGLSCKGTDTCEVVVLKQAGLTACLYARERVRRRCFWPDDAAWKEHDQVVQDTINAILACNSRFTQAGCFAQGYELGQNGLLAVAQLPQPFPTPEVVPTPPPPVSVINRANCVYAPTCAGDPLPTATGEGACVPSSSATPVPETPTPTPPARATAFVSGQGCYTCDPQTGWIPLYMPPANSAAFRAVQAAYNSADPELRAAVPMAPVGCGAPASGSTTGAFDPGAANPTTTPVDPPPCSVAAVGRGAPGAGARALALAGALAVVAVRRRRRAPSSPRA